MVSGALLPVIETAQAQQSRETYYIGWDVGGWNCDKNDSSRDAVVILDTDLQIVGKPWRGNLREDINRATTSSAWLLTLFERCGSSHPVAMADVTLAIDNGWFY